MWMNKGVPQQGKLVQAIYNQSLTLDFAFRGSGQQILDLQRHRSVTSSHPCDHLGVAQLVGSELKEGVCEGLDTSQAHQKRLNAVNAPQRRGILSLEQLNVRAGDLKIKRDDREQLFEFDGVAVRLAIAQNPPHAAIVIRLYLKVRHMPSLSVPAAR